MKLGPLVLFEHEVSDEVYVPVFREAFSKLETTVSILKRHGLVLSQEMSSHMNDLGARFLEGDRQAGEEYNAHFLQCAEVLADHIVIAQAAHNRLVSVWPRKALRGAHWELIWTMRAYMAALTDSVEVQLILGRRGQMERLEHHRIHRRQWDDLATKRATKLFGHVRKLQADEPKTFEAMVGVDVADSMARFEQGNGDNSWLNSWLREHGQGTYT